MKVDLRLVSPLTKVFLDEAPEREIGRVSGFLNENISFQAAWRGVGLSRPLTAQLEIDAPTPMLAFLRVRRVCHVPVKLATFEAADDDYLRKSPGLYPDLLREPDGVGPDGVGWGEWAVYPEQWESAWFDIDLMGAAFPGIYPVEVRLTDMDGAVLAARTLTVELLAGQLPEQKLIRTHWFHCDGLLTRYHVTFGSEAFFRIAGKFVGRAAERGINMILTHTHTPPLDTAVGGERLTTQLVRMEVVGGEYRFDFEWLDRWVEMCLCKGVKYFEIPHLFTQWGARHAPKIVARMDGVEKRIFGWETDAADPAYIVFLRAYLGALTARLRELGVADRCFFHISDEPSLENLDDYRAARESVAEALEGFPVVDALSDFEFYRTGAVPRPIPASNHIRPFIDASVENLWTYYCCGQYRDVSNTFIAMPGARHRILGVQLYKYRIEGFLQWGYNFYNSQYSLHPVDPYLTTDGDGFVPAGDPFQVYPGEDGPEDSIRLMVMDEAMNDLRALQLLEALRGRPFALRLIEEGLDEPITFDRYPRGEDFMLDLRERVNRAIVEALRD